MSEQNVTLLISISEAAKLSGLGINKIKKEVKKEDCPFSFKNGPRNTMIKKEEFIEFIHNSKGI